jgi:hypothetical protein
VILQPRRPPRVIRRPLLRVLPAIQLNHQPILHAGKIDNERPDRVLPPKLTSFQSPPAQQKPKSALDFSHVASERPCIITSHRLNLRAVGKQTIANRTPLPRLRERSWSEATRVRVVPRAPPSPASQELRDLGPLFAAQARKARES